MQKQDIKDVLIDFGLSEFEALVYLASLSLGPATVNDLAKHSGVKRTTVYPVIDSLKNKGIMNIEMKGLKKSYVAESPERLEGIIEQKKERLKNMMPELTAIKSLKHNESFIKYYEGISGVKTVYDSILDGLKSGDEYLIISDMERFLKMDREYFTNFIERRAKLNLKVKTIIHDSEDAQYYKKIERNTNQEIKILNKSADFTANLVILPNKVVITQIVEPIISIVIENKSIVDMQRKEFNIIWNSIK
jgi:HTH-type transcriptional regulator, sugar sensing transcriptional regulator